MEFILLGIFLYAAVFGTLGLAIGREKGLGTLGFVVGAILGPLGVALTLAMPPAPSHVCPECGGLISPAYRKCKSCGSELTGRAS